jgi:hypothetical protein
MPAVEERIRSRPNSVAGSGAGVMISAIVVGDAFSKKESGRYVLVRVRFGHTFKRLLKEKVMVCVKGLAEFSSPKWKQGRGCGSWNTCCMA